MSREIAVKVNHIAKTFHENKGSSSFKEAFINIGRRITGKKEQRLRKGDYTALKDINFEIKKGEFFGIVGRNGCGKSTLLKIIAGVYTPSKGAVQVNGSLTPFIELGVGFNPELSGRDNVFLNGALLGFTRKQIELMYDDIVEFAELKGFMNTKLKNYSSGMQVRLAFSVAIRAQSDILLIDEVLAVGDAAFQQKCFSYFEKLKKNKKTIIFVTHDMASVRQFCDKAIYIEEGRISKCGKPEDISVLYEKKNYESIIESNDGDKLGDMVDVGTYKNNLPKTNFKVGDDLLLKIDWNKINRSINIIGIVIKCEGQVVFATNSINQVNIANEKMVTFILPNITLGNGRYTVSVGLFGDDRHDFLGLYDNIKSFTVYGNELFGHSKDEWSGVTYLANEWKL